jgi:nucleotide-binding universal stress UspA family protein
VLAAVDETTAAFRAASYAAGLARRTGSRLVLVHVQRPPVCTITVDGLCSTSLGRSASIEAPPASLTRLRASIEEAYGVDVDVAVLEGVPTVEIAALADELRADVVVVGSPQSLRHRIIGSVSAHLVRHGNWPVTVVP